MSKTVVKNSRESLSENGSVINLLFTVKAVALSYAVSVVLLLAVALIAAMQSMSDKGIGVLVNIVTAVCVLFCGFLTGRRSPRGGLFAGAVAGITYTIILCVLGKLISRDMSIGLNAITAQVIGIVCGAVGGIVGINTKKQRKR